MLNDAANTVIKTIFELQMTHNIIKTSITEHASYVIPVQCTANILLIELRDHVCMIIIHT